MSSPRDIPAAALRAPLTIKVVGANAAVVALFAVAWALRPTDSAWVITAIAAIAVAAHLALVAVALKPVRDIESVVARVWRGEFDVRVTQSPIADLDVARLGGTLNRLLDGLAEERERMRLLAGEVIAVGDRERAALATTLQASTAQRVAVLQWQLAAAVREAGEGSLADRLRTARDLTSEVLEEIRSLASDIHPGVLDDLGLTAALKRLARDASAGTGIDIAIDTTEAQVSISRSGAAALFRVAQEAVRNAMRHGQPRHIWIDVHTEPADYPTRVVIDVHDDGTGFDLDVARRTTRGAGLLTMRERLASAMGTLEIKTARHGGTTVSATVPIEDGKRNTLMESA